MSGFRVDIAGCHAWAAQGHVFVYTQDEPAMRSIDQLALQIEALPRSRTQAMPIIEQQVLASFGSPPKRRDWCVASVLEDLEQSPIPAKAARMPRKAFGFGEGKNGGDVIMVGRFLGR